MHTFTINAENVVAGLTLDFQGAAGQDVLGEFHRLNAAEVLHVERHPLGTFLHVLPTGTPEAGALAVTVEPGQAYPILG